MSRERRRLLISGRVQGVGYRWACRRMAEGLGVNGWCRNLGDGRVEACFEGSPEAVAAAVAWAADGPAHAQVLGVEQFEEEPGDLRGFVLG